MYVLLRAYAHGSLTTLHGGANVSKAGGAGGREEAVTSGREGIKPGDAHVVKGGLEGEKGGYFVGYGPVTAGSRPSEVGRGHTRCL